MVPATRRRLLHVAAAVATGLAGCGSFTGDTAQSSRSVSENDGSVPPGNTETDPPRLWLRADSARPPLRLSESGGTDDSDRTETPLFARSDRRLSRDTREIVDSRSRGERLVVTDSVAGIATAGTDADSTHGTATAGTDADGTAADAVSSFVSETDFDEQTLYLETTLVEECFRISLCHVSWQSDEVRTDYVRELRPYDEHCVADARVGEARLVRLPVALDRDEVRSFGTSIGSASDCNSPRVRAVASSDSGGSSPSSNRTTTGGEE